MVRPCPRSRRAPAASRMAKAPAGARSARSRRARQRLPLRRAPVHAESVARLPSCQVGRAGGIKRAATRLETAATRAPSFLTNLARWRERVISRVGFALCARLRDRPEAGRRCVRARSTT